MMLPLGRGWELCGIWGRDVGEGGMGEGEEEIYEWCKRKTEWNKETCKGRINMITYNHSIKR